MTDDFADKIEKYLKKSTKEPELDFSDEEIEEQIELTDPTEEKDRITELLKEDQDGFTPEQKMFRKFNAFVKGVNMGIDSITSELGEQIEQEKDYLPEDVIVPEVPENLPPDMKAYVDYIVEKMKNITQPTPIPFTNIEDNKKEWIFRQMARMDRQLAITLDPEFSDLIQFCRKIMTKTDKDGNIIIDIEVEQFLKHCDPKFMKKRGGGGWSGAVKCTLAILRKWHSRKPDYDQEIKDMEEC